MSERLRLRAVDQEDLHVIAACLQDALVPLNEMAYMADDQRFMAAFDRFQWEQANTNAEGAGLMICQSALRVDHVHKVKYRGIDHDLDGIKFELLTIGLEPVDRGGFDIDLLFAGNVAIKLHVSAVDVVLEDFGEPLAAPTAPRHDLSDDR